MSQNKSGGIQGMLAAIVIPAALVIAVVIFKFVLGNSSNFQDNNPELNPLPGNFLGIVYKGGFIVPILMALLMITITFVIERFITQRDQVVLTLSLTQFVNLYQKAISIQLRKHVMLKKGQLLP